MTTNPTNFNVCLTVKNINNRNEEESYRYVTLPITNENLKFIKALHEICYGKVSLTNVEVSIEEDPKSSDSAADSLTL